jgi:hypothetical protein
MHLLPEGVKAKAEAFSDLLLRTAFDEDAAQGLVEALGLARGLKEETATKGVVHNGFPGCESFR